MVSSGPRGWQLPLASRESTLGDRAEASSTKTRSDGSGSAASPGANRGAPECRAVVPIVVSRDGWRSGGTVRFQRRICSRSDCSGAVPGLAPGAGVSHESPGTTGGQVQ